MTHTFKRRILSRVRSHLGPTEWKRRALRDQNSLSSVLPLLLRADSACVDIGAHNGAVLRQFIHLAPLGRHIAVEPLPEMAERLRQHFPMTEIHECAVAERSGTTTFYRAVDRPAWSGLQPQDYPTETAVEGMVVRIATLDEIVAERPVALIKVDVEGGELGVILGGSRTLATGPSLIFEFAEMHARHYGTTSKAIWGELNALGYAICRLDGRERYSQHEFEQICRYAHENDYSRSSETNFLALSGASA